MQLQLKPTDRLIESVNKACYNRTLRSWACPIEVPTHLCSMWCKALQYTMDTNPTQRKRCGQEEFRPQVCFPQILKQVFGCWQQTDIGQSPFTLLGAGSGEEESRDAKISLEALNSASSFLMRLTALQSRYSTHPWFRFISILSFLSLWATVSGWALGTWVV